MIKQLIPQEYCLKCSGCCRFSEENSVWSPCLLDEEVVSFIDKPGLPAVSVSVDKRICLVANTKGQGFICPLLDIKDNKCRVYQERPFECQLYPFLICLRGKKVHLTVDLNCPYVKENLNSPQLKEYIKYLTDYLNQPKQRKLLLENPQILQAYEEVLDIMELDLTKE
ncbi:MAG: YkgJ family cysteine cluster protein [Candidatus Omnitrophica bacterium]|nr:YkgJ family cysteine cluster protein [Candidatus Omnitrophota bacterium]